eukprot:snap_masked-scaffold_10-processed-gene-8.21-mRNA-1 protein AED:1.00 eAED:1.00 QI:0/0/0/0/1/1/2/0/61
MREVSVRYRLERMYNCICKRFVVEIITVYYWNNVEVLRKQLNLVVKGQMEEPQVCAELELD